MTFEYIIVTFKRNELYEVTTKLSQGFKCVGGVSQDGEDGSYFNQAMMREISPEMEALEKEMVKMEREMERARYDFEEKQAWMRSGRRDEEGVQKSFKNAVEKYETAKKIFDEATVRYNEMLRKQPAAGGKRTTRRR